MKVLIFGGHGKVALRTHPLLVAAGHEVAAVIRNPDQWAEVERAGARPVVSDVEHLDDDGFERLVAGFDAIVWSAGAGGGDADRTYAVDRDAAIASMDAAGRAGVQKYVMVSYFGAGPDHGVPEDDRFYAYADAKAAADDHLMQTALEWTVLRPSALTLDEPTARIDASASAATEVSRGNVARVIAAVVTDVSGASRRTVIEFNDGQVPIEDVIG